MKRTLWFLGLTLLVSLIVGDILYLKKWDNSQQDDPQVEIKEKWQKIIQLSEELATKQKQFSVVKIDPKQKKMINQKLQLAFMTVMQARQSVETCLQENKTKEALEWMNRIVMIMKSAILLMDEAIKKPQSPSPGDFFTKNPVLC